MDLRTPNVISVCSVTQFIPILWHAATIFFVRFTVKVTTKWLLFFFMLDFFREFNYVIAVGWIENSYQHYFFSHYKIFSLYGRRFEYRFPLRRGKFLNRHKIKYSFSKQKSEAFSYWTVNLTLQALRILWAALPVSPWLSMGVKVRNIRLWSSILTRVWMPKLSCRTKRWMLL